MQLVLFFHGINYNDLPAWQKRGVGFYWEDYQKTGLNPLTQQPVETTRRRLATHLELPLGEAYESFIRRMLPASAA
jgi:tRNA(His) guanylyltransferase